MMTPFSVSFGTAQRLVHGVRNRGLRNRERKNNTKYFVNFVKIVSHRCFIHRVRFYFIEGEAAGWRTEYRFPLAVEDRGRPGTGK
jgi:hypothetical protein